MAAPGAAGASSLTGLLTSARFVSSQHLPGRFGSSQHLPDGLGSSRLLPGRFGSSRLGCSCLRSSLMTDPTVFGSARLRSNTPVLAGLRSHPMDSIPWIPSPPLAEPPAPCSANPLKTQQPPRFPLGRGWGLCPFLTGTPEPPTLLRSFLSVEPGLFSRLVLLLPLELGPFLSLVLLSPGRWLRAGLS